MNEFNGMNEQRRRQFSEKFLFSYCLRHECQGQHTLKRIERVWALSSLMRRMTACSLESNVTTEGMVMSVYVLHAGIVPADD